MSDTHPLWRPYDPPTPAQIAEARVAPADQARVEVVSSDVSTPEQFARVRDAVLSALGDRVLSLEHVGSTSVPGLWAKPIIDVDLTVADSGDEAGYLPELEAADNNAKAGLIYDIYERIFAGDPEHHHSPQPR